MVFRAPIFQKGPKITDVLHFRQNMVEKFMAFENYKIPDFQVNRPIELE